MRFGINLPNFGSGIGPDTLRGWATTAERLGYHLLTVSDHIALTSDAHSRSPAPFYDSFTTLAWLAGQTSTIELGTGVAITPQRHPLQLARVSASLDQLSGGRLVLGVGVGWAYHAFQALGVPYEKRGALTDEYLSALRVLWTEEVASFHGPTVDFDGVHTAPRPARSPHPPVWVGGNSRAAVRRAARYGDAWHPMWPQGPELAPALRTLADDAAAAGRPTPAFCPTIPLALTDKPVPRHLRRLGQGTLEQLHSDLVLLERLGAQYVGLNTELGDHRRRRPAQDDWAIFEHLANTVLDTTGESLR
ncbi:LLM class flavin-dependent oxidoreductase [Streptomyces roseofulvus]|uniref:TIGR03619 family F420-dependent LLM class oxidoreductase n=2 Tax=Streptomyces TaxID=1883 RepID=A0ABU4K1I0_9ACTN|nr:TIGR03619 family F420-dependent LLM class oxidoreductase [Streptomyces roseolus]MDX2291606.1 TIGR03619 family F420-dependent LLM class oxidoreductase [Streptomyces roseolus]